MRDFIEGVFLCIGVGLFYFAADANDSGHTSWAVWLVFGGSMFLILFFLLAVHHAERRR